MREAVQKARSIAAYITKPDNRISQLLKQLLKEVQIVQRGPLFCHYSAIIFPHSLVFPFPFLPYPPSLSFLPFPGCRIC